MRDPILICGCPGSGTSLLAKMLRHCGVFLGADSGPIDERKFHESRSFRDVNERILSHTIDFPHAPKGEWQFRQHNHRMLASVDSIMDLIDTNDLLTKYWGSAKQNRPWGWKDPRNSPNAMVWQTLFPRLRILMIHRKWSRKVAAEHVQSLAGEWFRRQSSKAIRRLYKNPVGVARSKITMVDFDRLIENGTELNMALSELGLKHLSVSDFQRFSEVVGIEPVKRSFYSYRSASMGSSMDALRAG